MDERTHASRHVRGTDAKGPIAFALLTVSDTRTASDDASGALLRELVLGAGHSVHAAAIVRDDPHAVREQVLAWAQEPSCDVIVSTGGTGFAGRDHTVEAVAGLFDVTIHGFGELFRMLSFEAVGSAAMLSRATAGVVRGKPLFLLPGSPNAVALAMNRLVLPEIGHVVGELRRQF